MKKPKVSYNAPVTLSFVLICFVVTFIGSLTDNSITDLLFVTYKSSYTDPMTYIRLFTHILGHKDWTHFLSNAVYLLLLGPMLEEKYGQRTLVHAFIFTALAAGVANFILFPNVPLNGANGVVFAFILLASFTGFRAGEIPLSFIVVVLFFVGDQLSGGTLIQMQLPNTIHIIGGTVGAIFAYNLNKKKM